MLPVAPEFIAPDVEVPMVSVMAAVPAESAALLLSDLQAVAASTAPSAANGKKDRIFILRCLGFVGELVIPAASWAIAAPMAP
jgi:hypothetical protein